MTPARKILLFAAWVALGLALVEIFARQTVKTTPARQTLERYQPAGAPHAVFLGSSLTDAALRTEQLDSLLSGRSPGFRSFNLALAGLSGSENYYLFLKNFLLARAHPDFLVVEAPGVPFFPSSRPFRLEGGGGRVESIRSELADYGDFRYLSGGFPGVAASLSFWLHKHWFSYHYRLEIQAKIRERIMPREPPARDGSGAAARPYRMARNALEMLARRARDDAQAMQARSDGAGAVRSRPAHFLDLAEMARVRGVRLVVLKPPCPPMDEVTRDIPAFASYQAGFSALCDSLGAVFVDLSAGDDCGPFSYSDGIHLDEAGARAFTACLARAWPR